MQINTPANPFDSLNEHMACTHGDNGAIDLVLFRDEVPAGFSRIRDFHIPLDRKVDLSMGMLAKVLAHDIEPGTIYPSTAILKSGVRVADQICDMLVRPEAGRA